MILSKILSIFSCSSFDLEKCPSSPLHIFELGGLWGVVFFVVVVIVESSMVLYSKLHIRRSFSENLKSSFMFITRTPG